MMFLLAKELVFN